MTYFLIFFLVGVAIVVSLIALLLEEAHERHEEEVLFAQRIREQQASLSAARREFNKATTARHSW